MITNCQCCGAKLEERIVEWEDVVSIADEYDFVLAKVNKLEILLSDMCLFLQERLDA